MVSIQNYYNDKVPNNTAVTIGNVTLYFSYRTIVAFTLGYELIISKNIWSVTTGRHLNAINSDKSIRIDNREFCKQLAIIENCLNDNIAGH